MNMELFYFSGTGNSLHIAKELQEKISGTELRPVVGALKKDKILTTAKTVGLIFPLHFFTLPFTVKKFLDKLDLKSAEYFFVIVNRGGSPCAVISDIENILKKKKRSLDAHFYIEMPCNCQMSSFFETVTPEKAAENERALQERLKSICEIITGRRISHEKDRRSGESIVREKIIIPLVRMIFKIAGKSMMNNKFNKTWYADSKCSGCGLCKEVCLSGKIGFENGKPLWNKNVDCMFCFGCINYCPLQAIQIRGLERKIAVLGRYNHFKIGADEISLQKNAGF